MRGSRVRGAGADALSSARFCPFLPIAAYVLWEFCPASHCIVACDYHLDTHTGRGSKRAGAGLLRSSLWLRTHGPRSACSHFASPFLILISSPPPFPFLEPVLTAFNYSRLHLAALHQGRAPHRPARSGARGEKVLRRAKAQRMGARVDSRLIRGCLRPGGGYEREGRMGSRRVGGASVGASVGGREGRTLSRNVLEESRCTRTFVPAYCALYKLRNRRPWR
ncbi:hypothetical protein FB451DRAFT_1177111 [Mycena latifolia]|nr:hypothetical protein FB451DRAFT_1177111 [Mycena latifolia]